MMILNKERKKSKKVAKEASRGNAESFATRAAPAEPELCKSKASLCGEEAARGIDQGPTIINLPVDTQIHNSDANVAFGVNAGSIKTETFHSNVVQNAIHLAQVVDTTVKTLWTAEIPSNPLVGREELLVSVYEKLKACATQQEFMKRVLALVSPPGMGKTEIARAFAHKYKSDYENVAWIDAATEISAREGFARVAKTLKLPISTEDTGKTIAERVYSHICNHFEKSTLFIFDHATRLRKKGKMFGIYEYLPTTQVKGSVPLILVTTRSKEWWREDCEAIEVPKLSNEECLLFFRSRFKLQSEAVEEDSRLKSLLENLAEKLNGSPGAWVKALDSISYTPAKDSIELLKIKLENYLDIMVDNECVKTRLAVAAVRIYFNSCRDYFRSRRLNLFKMTAREGNVKPSKGSSCQDVSPKFDLQPLQIEGQVLQSAGEKSLDGPQPSLSVDGEHEFCNSTVPTMET